MPALPPTPPKEKRKNSSGEGSTSKRRKLVGPAPKTRSMGTQRTISKRNKSTQTGSVKKVKLQVSTKGDMGAVMSAPRRAKDKQVYWNKFGVSEKYELPGDENGAEIIYLGHHDMPKARVMRAVWRSLVKRLFMKVGNLPVDLAAQLPFLQATDVIRAYVRNSPNDAVTFVTIPIIVGDSIITIADKFAVTFNVTSVAYQMTEIMFVPASGSIMKFTRLPIVNAKLHLKCKSTLTVQNSSLSGTSPSTDIVTAVSLHGKYYKGRGTGTNYLDGATTIGGAFGGFFGNNENGIMVPALALQLYEPPEGYQFPDVKKVGNISFNPGEIRQSIVTTDIKISFDKLFRAYVENPDQQYAKFDIGKFAFLAVEKRIEVPDQPMQLNWTLDLNIACVMKPGTYELTCPYVTDVLPS